MPGEVWDVRGVRGQGEGTGGTGGRGERGERGGEGEHDAIAGTRYHAEQMKHLDREPVAHPAPASTYTAAPQPGSATSSPATTDPATASGAVVNASSNRPATAGTGTRTASSPK